jgi:cell division transport system permease protein
MTRIPLQPETSATRALALTVTALMVALGIIALAGAAALRHVEQGWRAALADRWTVELTGADVDQPVPQADVDRVLGTLRTTPGVSSAQPIESDEIRRLLRPWLGDDVAVGALPLPVLIDVTIDPARSPAPSAVTERITPIVHGARVDDHGSWTRDLARLAGAGEAVGLALFAVIAAIMALTIAAAARTRLAINRPEIELLHTLGATDSYIARQFQAGAFRSAIVGALVGTILAGGALAGFLGIGPSFAPLIPKLALEPVDWAALAAVPIAAILLATLVARGTALTLVGRLP